MPRVIKEQDAKDACWILEYLIHDLVVAHQLYDLFDNIGKSATVRPETEKAVRRMYISYLLLALGKFSEFYGKASVGWARLLCPRRELLVINGARFA